MQKLLKSKLNEFNIKRKKREKSQLLKKPVIVIDLVLLIGASPSANLLPSCTDVSKLVRVAVDRPASWPSPTLDVPQKLSRPLVSDMLPNKA